MALPTWVVEHRLKKVGLYYEGYVDIDLVRQQHQAYTISTFGIRHSRVNNATTHATGVNEHPTGKENKVHCTMKNEKEIGYIP